MSLLLIYENRISKFSLYFCDWKLIVLRERMSQLTEGNNVHKQLVKIMA